MDYKTFLFTYSFDGEKWEVPIKAITMEEAKARVMALCDAEYTGELMFSIPVPRFTWWTKFSQWANRG